MDEPQGVAAFSHRASFGLRFFFVRVALIVMVLAIPILGTSYVLVSQVNRDISMARAEHTALADFERIVDVFSLIERLRDRMDHADVSAVASARTNAADALAAAQRTFERPNRLPKTDRIWSRIDPLWARLERETTVPNLDAVLSELADIGNELDDNSPLDVDPDFAVQNLTAAILRQEPRSIVALRQTGEAVATLDGARLTVHAAEDIARRRALEEQALSRSFSDIEDAQALEPTLGPKLGNQVSGTEAATTAYERRVDALLATSAPDRRDASDIELAARRAIDAHIGLWRLTLTAADTLIVNRLNHQIVRQRVSIALALLAVLAAALAVTFVSRYEARRDRVELASARFEADKLRSELSRISVERALRLQEAQFKTVFENADLGIAIFDPRGHILQHNSAVTDSLGSATQTVLDALRPVIAEFGSANHEPFTRDEYRLADDDRPQWLSLTFSGVYEDDVCQLVIVLIRDATEEKLLAAQLAHDASHDSLTGIANRAAFERALNDEIANHAPHHAFALMYIDLDTFKPINDRFGHRAGDHVLVTTAGRLRSTVGADDLCARLGGDEFALLLRGVDDPAMLGAIAQRVGSSIAEPIAYDNDTTLSVTASIGIAIGSANCRSSDEIKRAADIALYAVKERGRNGHVLYHWNPAEVTARS